MSDLIVIASAVLTLAFIAAWASSPRLRARIERPKYRFQDAVSDYDRTEGGHRGSA